MAAEDLAPNHEKLKNLLVEVFLLDPGSFTLDLRRDDIDTWDSLGVVSMAVGIQETFGYHMTQTEALGVESVRDIIAVLQSNGISFHD